MKGIAHGNRADAGRQMKIAQLCEESGFTRSTIHYYLNMGLLDPPRKVGLNLSVYDEKHLAQLRQIRHLREQEKLPLSIIKEILQQQEDSRETRPSGLTEPKLIDQKKEQILKVATELFSQKGYEKTTISDIADALSMGRGTFYLYFKDKRELFIECIEHLTMVIVPREAWEEIRAAKDPVHRQKIRVLTFLKAFPGFRGILNLLRQAMVGDDLLLAEKAKLTYKSLIQPLAKDFRVGIAKGAFRKMDDEMTSHFGFALAEMLAYVLVLDNRYTVEEGVDILIDYVSRGVLTRPYSDTVHGAEKELQGEIIDKKGVTTKLREIRFDGSKRLIGRLGEAEVHLELDNIASFQIKHGGAQCQMEMRLLDGQSLTLELDGDISLSGQTPFGKFTIPLAAVHSVAFQNDAQRRDSPFISG